MLVVAAGCAPGKPARPDEAELLSRVEPVWYTWGQSLSLVTWSGQVQPHFFYDPSADFNARRGLVNFLPMAVAGQTNAYVLDVPSGQRVFSHQSCPQKDVWGERGDIPAAAPYTLGVVPRHLDQLNQPQRIIVFGGETRYDARSPVLHRVRLVGGVVEQLCPVGLCGSADAWRGRLLLVAVDTRDQRFQDVDGMDGLLKRVDWNRVRGHLENAEGRNPTGEEGSPAVRLGQPLGRRETVAFLRRHSVVLTSGELTKLHRACTRLQGLLWNEAGRPTVLEQEVKTPADAKRRLQYREEMKKKGRPVTFNQRLGGFFARHADEYATCARTVIPGNPNGDAARFWFNTWISMYARLHREGWVYDCGAGRWSETRRSAEESMRALKSTSSCSTARLDQGISQIPAFLRVLTGLQGVRWRFVDWDAGALGSRSKVYGWVPFPERLFACVGDLNREARAGWAWQPEGEPWAPRHRREAEGATEYVP